jgi:DNA polymerase V
MSIKQKPQGVTAKKSAVHPPLYTAKVAAGFPLPGDDSVERALSLDSLLIENSTATFFVRAEGDSMEGIGIMSGDILVVDRSKPAVHGSVVVAALFGDLVVKRLQKKGEKTYLVSENEKYEPILLGENDDCHVWGVVIASVTRFQ